MTHLTETEFVDLLEGVLAEDRRRHATTCAACGAKAEEITRIAATAAAVEVPEPSPLFWEQFSSSVQDAVAAERAPRPSFWSAVLTPRVRIPLVAATAVLIALAVSRGALWQPAAPAPATPPLAITSVPDVDMPWDDAMADLDGDEGWALVRSLAEEMAADGLDRQGVSARPGASEHLALRMTDSERTELARLIAEQMETRPAAKSES